MKRLQFPLVVLFLVLAGMCLAPDVRAEVSAPGAPEQPPLPGIADRLSLFAQGDPAVAERAYAAAASVPIQRLAQFGGDAQVVAVRGSTAFVGVGPRLLIYDITDPAQPVFLGQTDPFPSLVINIAVAGDYAYVANYLGGVQIVRIADPAHPVWVATFDAPQLGAEFDVAVAGSYLYVANGAADLRVVDVSNPAQPVERAALVLPGQSLGVTLVGNLAYVAALDAGLQIVDVADPLHPQVIGSRDTPGTAIHLVVGGDVAYVADLAGGVRIINVVNSAAPVEVASVQGGADIQMLDVAVHDHYLYGIRTPSSNVTQTLLAWDVLDPVNPVALGTASGSSSYGTPQRLLVSNGLLHIAFGLEGWAVHRPTPQDTNSAVRVAGRQWVNGTSLDSTGNALYVNNSLQALSIYDVSVPADPARLYEGDLDLGEWVEPWGYWARWYGCRFLNLGSRDNYVYMLMFPDELVTINVANPAQPAHVGAYLPRGHSGGEVEGFSLDVVFRDQYAFIAYEFGGLLVLNIANPSHPTKAALFDTPGNARGVAVAGNYAYVADREGGLRVIDIADPAQPREVASYSTGTFNAMQVAAWDHYVAVTQQFSIFGLYTSDLLVLDVADPTHPVKAGESIQAPAAVLDLAVDSQYAYIANGDLGLRVLDISDPAHPTDAALYDTAGAAQAVDVQGNTIYVGDGQGGVYILGLGAMPPQVKTYLPLVVRGLTAPVDPTHTPTATMTASTTPSSTPTATGTTTSSPTPTSTPTATATPTPSATPTETPSSTSTWTPSPTPTWTPSPSPTPTVTPPPSATPTATDSPTFTPTVTPGSGPQDGAWSAVTDQGNAFSFQVSGGGTRISQVVLRVNAGGACGVSSVDHYFYDIVISGGVFDATSLESELDGSFTSATAAGTYKSVISNPLTGCRATRTGTWTATWDGPAQQGIYGRVTHLGSAAAGVPLQLRYFSGSSWSTQATTTTDADGRYSFQNVPGLATGAKYYVLFGRNDTNPAWVSFWVNPDITYYAAGSAVLGGNFDLADIPLSSPAHGFASPLPITFQWAKRSISTDTYRWVMFDPDTGAGWMTNDLGSVNGFTMTTMPSGALYGKLYGWWVRAYQGANSYGYSFEARGFTVQGAASSADDPVALAPQALELSPMPALFQDPQISRD